ncbi:MAG TPA: cysteine--tRNA ligase [Bacteroidetes bacterium]|nr:cysteine--tRNA ligase [Bacteroidota bacterium]
MTQLKITNSYTREKEIFEPLHAPHVGMYVCGPTVSGETHLGHARPYVTFDVLYRYLKYLGYKVRYVRNITDAGHFEEEGREAVDKVATKAKLEMLEPMELVTKYTNIYHDMMELLNNQRPSIEPTATGHIVEQIEMIKDLIAKGFAYEKNGSVYFDVLKYAKGNDYGKLSGRILDDMIAGSRELENQGEKNNAADFALWKKAAPEHIMQWQSPWGMGFPGWHIECSAMATKYLGTTFDIHGGGMDLLFPHHESEIAQSSISNGKPPVKYWMHNNMITVNGKKMGKSYGNTITLNEMFTGTHELLEQGYSPITVRFFILQTHYRSTLDFTNDSLKAAEKGLQRLLNAHNALRDMTYKADGTIDSNEDSAVNKLCLDCHDQMNDDLGTAQVLATLFDLSSRVNSWKNGQQKMNASEETFNILKKTFHDFIDVILGLKDERTSGDEGSMDAVMQLVISLRKQAREKKDFTTSDIIRDELLKAGIQLKDGKDGTSWEKS